MVVVAAAGIEPGATGRALVRRVEILADRQLDSTNAAQDGGLIPFALWPYLNRVAGERVVAVLAGIVISAALHPDRNYIDRLVVMRTAGLSVNVNSIHMRPGIWHTY
jgi:hypothetical protein